MMAIRLCPLGMMLALLATDVSAQPDLGRARYNGEADGATEPSAPSVLFISPCGRPYRARPGEPHPVEMWFREIDTDQDGALVRDELRAEAAAFFAVLDEDRDGLITGPEVTRYERSIVPEILSGGRMAATSRPGFILAQMSGGGMGGGGMGGGGMGGGPGGGRIPPGGGRGPMPMMEGAAPFNFLGEPEPVSSSDGDFDRRITAAEFLAASDRRFRKLDKDEDGKLTLATLPLTLQQRMAARGPRGRAR